MRTILSLLILFFCVGASAEIKIEKLAKSKWIEVRSPNFTVITDADKKTGQALVRDLEDFRFFIAYMLKRPLIENSPPLKVFAINNAKTFDAMALPETWGGVFSKLMHDDVAIANISGYSHSQFRKNQGNNILLHEYVHYATRNIVTTISYPLWYSEGEAEYLSTFQFEDRGKSVSVGSMDVIGFRLYSLRNPSGSFKDVDVEDLFKTKNIELSWREGEKTRKEERELSKKGAEFYARAMITYHYLFSSNELIKQTNHYISLINQGNDEDFSFTTAYGTSWDELNNAINKYARSNTVNAWKFDLSKAGLSFPEIESSVSAIPKPTLISHLASVLSRFPYFSKDEIEALFAYAKQQGDKNAELSIAEINWLMSNGMDVSPVVEQALADFPDDSSINAFAATLDITRVQALLYVGHPSANTELIKLRKTFRKIIRADDFNRLAYFSMGGLITSTDDPGEDILKEAEIMLESAKLLMSEGYRPHIINQEISVNTLLQNPMQLLRLKYQLATISDTEWIKNGYGRFVLEMLESGTYAQSRGKVDGNTIRYSKNSYYEGEIENELPHGTGTVNMYYGAKLSGRFEAGKLSGAGELNTSNGYHYHGEFKDGYLTGIGTLTFPKGKHLVQEVGGFVLGQEHGHQIQTFSNGDIFEAEFRAGVMNGVATITKKDGAILEREFYLGAMRYNVDDNLLFAGGWDENYLPNGAGNCFFKRIDEVKPCFFNHGKPQAKFDIPKPSLDGAN